MKLDQLYEQLSQDFAGSTYVVERTDDGFKVTINVVDAKYYAILYQQRIKHVRTYHVAVDEETDTYTITHDLYEVEWQRGVSCDGGVPQIVLRGSKSRQLGTWKTYSRRTAWAWDEEGRFGKVID